MMLSTVSANRAPGAGGADWAEIVVMAAETPRTSSEGRESFVMIVLCTSTGANRPGAAAVQGMTGALVFATGLPVILRITSVESIAMRLYQQIRASIVRSAVAGAGALVFVSGITLSASGQAPPSQPAAQLPPIAAAPAPPGTPLSMEEAVK